MNIYEKIGAAAGAWMLVIILLLIYFFDNYQFYKKQKKKLEKFDTNKSSVTNESGMELYIGDDISKIRRSLKYDIEDSFDNCIKIMIGILIALVLMVYTIFSIYN